MSLTRLRRTLRRLAGRHASLGLAQDLWRLARIRHARRTGERGTFGIHNIELTNKCPMKCVMCPRTHQMTRDQGLMEFDTFARIIDELSTANPAFCRDNVVWLHHFGESLMHPEFGRFIRYGTAKGVRLGMSINPVMLKPEVAAELLDSGIEVLRISLDGHDDESFEKVRGMRNAYERSKRNLLDFLERKIRTGARTRVILSMIEFGLNADSIDSVGAFWQAQPGIESFDRKEFVSFSGDDAVVNDLDPGAGRRSRGRFVACLRPWQTVTVAWDGDVVPCCYDYDKHYVLGNVRQHSLAEIWTGERMRTLRDEFRSNRVTNPLCRNCPDLDVPAESPP